MRVNDASMCRYSTYLVLASLFVVGCGQNSGSGGSKVVKSSDGKFQVTIPSGWTVQTELHDEADIQVANPAKEGYVVVLTESKADFETPTIEWHSELTRSQILDALSGGRITAGPKELQINGRPGVQYEIRGTTDGLQIVYLHTTVDTGEHLHQILAWTLPSQYDSNRAVLQSVVNSFKATSP